HDIKLGTGSINVILYGSYLQEGRERTTQGRSYDDGSVYNVIGDDPVTDSYDLAYAGELSGSYLDDFVTGSLVTKARSLRGGILLVTGSRAKVFSKFNARGVDNPRTRSKSFNLQPWFERAGSARFASAVDYTER